MIIGHDRGVRRRPRRGLAAGGPERPAAHRPGPDGASHKVRRPGGRASATTEGALSRAHRQPESRGAYAPQWRIGGSGTRWDPECLECLYLLVPNRLILRLVWICMHAESNMYKVLLLVLASPRGVLQQGAGPLKSLVQICEASTTCYIWYFFTSRRFDASSRFVSTIPSSTSRSIPCRYHTHIWRHDSGRVVCAFVLRKHLAQSHTRLQLHRSTKTQGFAQ